MKKSFLYCQQYIKTIPVYQYLVAVYFQPKLKKMN